MSIPTSHPSYAILECLQNAVNKDLERKRRLGQYAVIWQNNAPTMIGEDAPSSAQVNNKKEQNQVVEAKPPFA